MKMVCLSDIHCNQKEIDMPPGDVVLIPGDISVFGKLDHFTLFIEWVNRIRSNYRAIVMTAGNHDTFLDPKFNNYHSEFERMLSDNGVTYLRDSGCKIGDLYFWGSPVTITYGDWAFNRDAGLPIKRHWDLIPQNIDVLLTHQPPKGIHDLSLGCEELKLKVEEIRPRLHVFGHIHPPYGQTKIDETIYANVSQSNIIKNRYVLVNKPLIIEI